MLLEVIGWWCLAAGWDLHDICYHLKIVTRFVLPVSSFLFNLTSLVVPLRSPLGT